MSHSVMAFGELLSRYSALKMLSIHVYLSAFLCTSLPDSHVVKHAGCCRRTIVPVRRIDCFVGVLCSFTDFRAQHPLGHFRSVCWSAKHVPRAGPMYMAVGMEGIGRHYMPAASLHPAASSPSWCRYMYHNVVFRYLLSASQMFVHPLRRFDAPSASATGCPAARCIRLL